VFSSTVLPFFVFSSSLFLCFFFFLFFFFFFFWIDPCILGGFFLVGFFWGVCVFFGGPFNPVPPGPTPIDPVSLGGPLAVFPCSHSFLALPSKNVRDALHCRSDARAFLLLHRRPDQTKTKFTFFVPLSECRLVNGTLRPLPSIRQVAKEVV